MKFKIIIAVLIVGFLGLAIYSRATSPGGTSANSDDIYKNLVGKKAPDFELPSYTGAKVSLSSLLGKKVVLFFNEGIVCYPACWNQVAALGTDKDLNNDTVATLSIVPDAGAEWVAAIQRQPDLGKETILLDSDITASKAYGVMSLSSSMHRGAKPGHTYVLVDQQGIVRYTYDDPTMGIQNDKLKQELSKI